MNKLHNYISHISIQKDIVNPIFKERSAYSGFDLELLLLNYRCFNQWHHYFKGTNGIILVYSS